MAKVDIFATLLLIFTVCKIQEGSSRSTHSEPVPALRHEREDTHRPCGLTLTKFKQELDVISRLLGNIEQNHGPPMTYKELQEFVSVRPNYHNFVKCLESLYKPFNREVEIFGKPLSKRQDSNRGRYPEIYERDAD